MTRSEWKCLYYQIDAKEICANQIKAREKPKSHLRQSRKQETSGTHNTGGSKTIQNTQHRKQRGATRTPPKNQE